MKVGDKVYCKKDRIWSKQVINVKNKEYNIIEINNDTICVTSEDSYSYFRTDSIDNDRYYVFDYYFYTEKELRKQKLKKLYGICL